MYRLSFAVIVTFFAGAFVGDVSTFGARGCGLKREESEIRSIDRAWSHAAETKNLDAVMAAYASDGSILPFNAPMATGTAAIRQVWSSLMSRPGYALTFSPSSICVSSSGDVAWELGTFELKLNDPSGVSKSLPGKYVVTWKKVADEWKVAADIFNTDD